MTFVMCVISYARARSRRIPLRMTISEVPTSAKTAIQSVALPPSTRIMKATLTSKLNPMFCAQHSQSLAAETDGEWQLEEIVTHQDDIRRLERLIRARAAHGDAHRRHAPGPGRRSHHRRPWPPDRTRRGVPRSPAPCLRGASLHVLRPRPLASRSATRRALVVASQHDGAADAGVFERGRHCAGVRADGVGHGHQPQQFRLAARPRSAVHQHHRVAPPAQAGATPLVAISGSAIPASAKNAGLPTRAARAADLPFGPAARATHGRPRPADRAAIESRPGARPPVPADARNGASTAAATCSTASSPTPFRPTTLVTVGSPRGQRAGLVEGHDAADRRRLPGTRRP